MIKIKNKNIYIVMYHYVREIKGSRYPNLKGLEFKEFKKQINFFKKNFNLLNIDNFNEILMRKKIPNKKFIMLTFDDGYIDHWKYVYPHLHKNRISGFFYPPVNVLKNQKVLDVNMIHFILEKEQNREKILQEIFVLTKKYMNKSEEDLNLNKINLKTRYDDKKTVLIKRLLQTYLPYKIRNKIVKKIFNKILNLSEKEFSKKLYIDEKHLVEMYENKMSFGSHGVDHHWWKNLNYADQSKEIYNSIKYFKKLNIYDENFSFCYPYGSYNSNTIKILKKVSPRFALTTKVGAVNKKNINQNLEFPRLNANDFKI